MKMIKNMDNKKEKEICETWVNTNLNSLKKEENIKNITASRDKVEKNYSSLMIIR
jgi:hypothetical protein